MRVIGAAVLVMVLAGCGGVKMVQRDGCWVRETKNWIGHTYDDVGPCSPPETEWSDDRLTRVVQECVARNDYHWRTRALLAWSKGQPLPENVSDAKVLQDCTDETSRALANDNDRLKQKNDLLSEQLGQTAKERDALRTRADDASTKLLASHEKLSDRLLTDQEKLGTGVMTAQQKLAEYLGEAAKKSSQPAVATANASSSSDGAVTTDSSNATSPAAPVVAAVPVPASSPVVVNNAPGVGERSPKPAVRATQKAAQKSQQACAPDAKAPQRQARSPKGAVRNTADACPPEAADAVVVPKATEARDTVTEPKQP